jgi:hypothetical protein
VFCLLASNGDVIVVSFEDKILASAYSWRRHRSGHYHTTDDARSLYIHRLVHGIDGPLVDHRNRSPWDNRRCNLRASDAKRNRHNVAGSATASSKYIGVDLYKGSYRARLQAKGIDKFLGLFNNELDAARVVMQARKELLGDHAYVDTLPTE